MSAKNDDEIQPDDDDGADKKEKGQKVTAVPPPSDAKKKLDEEESPTNDPEDSWQDKAFHFAWNYKYYIGGLFIASSTALAYWMESEHTSTTASAMRGKRR